MKRKRFFITDDIFHRCLFMNRFSQRFEGMMINRLIVLLQIIIFPLFFYLWAWLGPYPESLANFFWWTKDQITGIPVSPFGTLGDTIILKVVGPLIFALPFTLVSIVKANRVASSYELMWRALGKVRIDTKIFYMVNAIFCLFFFILPFGAPVIAVFGAFFAVKLILYAFGVKKNIPAILIVIPGLFLAAIPLMISIAFYSEYQTVIKPIWDFWVHYSPIFYGFVLCLACAIAIGNFYMFVREGASQVSYKTQLNERIGIFIKTLLFGGFVLLYVFVDKLDSTKTSMFIINIIAVSLGLLEGLIRWRKKISNDEGGGGRLMVVVFIAVNFVARYLANPSTAITIIVALSACIFFILFILAYRYAEDETLF